MKLPKLILKLFALFFLLTAGFCEDEPIEFSCDDCIEAQAQLCSALSVSNCSNDNRVSQATDLVIERCPNGSLKAAAMRTACGFGELSANCTGFSCN